MSEEGEAGVDIEAAFRAPSIDPADAAAAALRERQGADPFAAPPAGLPQIVNALLAATALVLLSPLLLAAMIAIRLSSPGPAIYRQRRVGRGEREFEMLKLRTMAAGSDPVGVGTAVGGDDPRITKVGGLLRRTSLDELPNLVNVLRGEMAIVGPRPTIPAHLEHYAPFQHRRHAVPPGMTGWAQVNGRVGVRWGERIERDCWYVENRSPALDLRIIARTVKQVVTGEGLDPG
ncbi:MAG: sugar transferase [Thermoleophilales bacterium]|nr:sugar transferase [Thermoleophilales bacterium]